MVKHKVFDRYPQWMKLRTIEDSANQFTSNSKNTPVVTGLENGTALVMNILRVFFALSNPSLAALDGWVIQLTKSEQSAAVRNDSPEVIATDQGLVGFTTSGGVFVKQSPASVWDLSDGQGNGLLFGKRDMHLSILGISQASALTAYASVLYRLVLVDAAELIGIIAE